MDIKVADLLTIKNEKYIVLEMLSYDGNNYAFVNKMTGDENATEDFYILNILNDNVVFVEDDNLKNVLIPMFQNLLKEDITKLMAE